MMGVTHAASGMLAGLVLAPVVGLQNIFVIAPFAITCAGFALLPDLDHPQSTATRQLGPITRLISWVLRRFSGALYQLTRGPRDENVSGTHRHASHTLIFAVLLGSLCWLTTDLWGGAAVFVWFALGVILAYDRLGRLVLIPFAVAAAGWLWQVDAGGLGTGPVPAFEQSGGVLGVAVAVGRFVHCLGDALTQSGCPFLFPIPIAGETWYEIRPPQALRFTTNAAVERWLVFPAMVIGCVTASPGGWPMVMSVVQRFSA
jgi:membrane-bound metal-dependent hydrolase YbcI (DUF457 family)